MSENFKILTAVLFAALITSCASTGNRRDSNYVDFRENLYPVLNKESKDEKMEVFGVVLENTDFDLPVVINSQVERWVDYFTGKGRRHFELYLKRSKYFIPYIQPILKENNVPLDLVYLAMIESGFNNHARSWARAVGPWQFIKATGRRYGLEVSWWIDERRDVEKSTLAAVNYLKDLYARFQSWELATSAYNAGEARIAKAVRYYGTRDFWVISRHRHLKAETRNYVPKMMAAAILAKNAHLFGFDLDREPASGPEPIEVTENQSPDLAQTESIHDPQILEEVLSDYDSDYGGKENRPAQAVATIVKQDDSSASPVNDRSAYLSKMRAKRVVSPRVNKRGEIGGYELSEFQIEGPADLLKIARASGLSYRQVKKLNPEVLRWCTPPNQKKFKIKLPAEAASKFLLTYNHPAFPREVQFRKYKVRRGDSLRRIARRHGIWIEPIKDLNGIRSNRQLRVGKRILLPLPSDRSRRISDLDVREPRRKRYRRYRKRHAAKQVKKANVVRVADQGKK